MVEFLEGVSTYRWWAMRARVLVDNCFLQVTLGLWIFSGKYDCIMDKAAEDDYFQDRSSRKWMERLLRKWGVVNGNPCLPEEAGR
jgi:hypothetical protein